MDGMLLDAGVNREFRVVRDNRTNANTSGGIRPPLVQSSMSTNKPAISNVPEMRYIYAFSKLM